MVECINLCRTVVTSGLKVKGMDLLPLAKMTISSGQLSTANRPGSMSLVTKGAAVTLSRTKPSRPLRVRRVLGDIAIFAEAFSVTFVRNFYLKFDNWIVSLALGLNFFIEL
jgi:hypothetical protein